MAIIYLAVLFFLPSYILIHLQYADKSFLWFPLVAYIISLSTLLPGLRHSIYFDKGLVVLKFIGSYKEIYLSDVSLVKHVKIPGSLWFYFKGGNDPIGLYLCTFSDDDRALIVENIEEAIGKMNISKITTRWPAGLNSMRTKRE